MRSRRLSVTLGVLLGSLTGLLSVDVGSLSLLRISNVIASGSLSVTIMGGGMRPFSVSSSAALYSTVCESSSWASDSSLTCRISAGAGRTRQVVVSALESLGCASEAWSYVSGNMCMVTQTNFAATGSISISLIGAGLSSTSLSAAARHGASACEQSVWISDTSVLSKGVSGGGVATGPVRVPGPASSPRGMCLARGHSGVSPRQCYHCRSSSRRGGGLCCQTTSVAGRL